MSHVDVLELISGPIRREPRRLTFDELRETFSPGDLVWELMAQIDEKQAVIEQSQVADARAISILEEIAGAMDALNYKPTAEHMRQAITILKRAPVSSLAFATAK